MSRKIKSPLFSRAGGVAMLFLSLAPTSHSGQVTTWTMDPRLSPVARIESKHIHESSGLAQSPRDPTVYWTHNDSGYGNQIFAIKADGSSVSRPEGISVTGAENVDWESIATCEDGYLWIGDVGNNDSSRRDLTIYRVEEPAYADTQTVEATAYPYRYEDQLEIPDPALNYDCEAIFIKQGVIYLLTKHWTTPDTRLYSIENPVPGTLNTARYLATYPIAGMVTGCDLRHDGRYLAVLTYTNVSLYQLPKEGPLHLENLVWRRMYHAGQAEGIAWKDDKTLLLTNENGNLYKLTIPWAELEE